MIHSDKEGPIYTPDDWTNLLAEVERQGSAILPELCEGSPLEFKASKNGKGSKTRTCHCGQASMAVVTYDPAVKAKDLQKVKERGGGFARVCLVCDVGGAWPRFASAVEQPIREEDEEDLEDE